MEIGRHSYIGKTGSDISTPVTIGNYTSIAPYVQMHARTDHSCITNPLFASTHQFRKTYPPVTSRREIVIGSDVWIGRNAILLGGITIGHGAIIGAYAVVAKDVHPYAIVVGNPIRILRYRFVPQVVVKLLELCWWDWPDDLIQERLNDFTDVNILIAKYG